MNRPYLYLLISLFSFCLSCTFNSDNSTYDLGDNYYYLADANESQILLNLKPNQRSKVGKTIIPAEVTEYNFNEFYIIAKSIDHKNKIELFWIVNKNSNDSIEALNLKGFSEKLETLKISLKLRPRE